MLNNLLTQANKLIANNTCFLCYKNSVNPLCESCIDNIKSPDYSCNICGAEMAEQTSEQICYNCLEKTHAYNHINYIGTYKLGLQELILRAKNNKDIKAVTALIYLIKQKSSSFLKPSSNSQTINLLPMPTPTSRLMIRGYNLPQLLSEAFKKQQPNLTVNIIPEKTITTPFYLKKQTGMTLKQRLINSHNFKVKKKIPKKIIIFDDVVTTTNTITELSLELRRNGAKDISVWSVSRGIMR